MTTREPFPRSAYAPDFGMYASRPASSPRGSSFSRGAYLFSWSLVGVAAVAGCLFSLDRNDVLLKEAQRRGLEAPYLALERKLVGTPGWGTPRSVAGSEPADASGAVGVASAPAVVSEPTHSAFVQADANPVEAKPSEAKPASATSERATSDGLKITSLDALAPLPAQAAAQRPAAAAPRTAPARATRTVEPKPAVAARAVSQAEKPAPQAAAQPKPAPVKAAPAPKPSPPPADDNPLKAAIRSAITKEAGK